MPVEYENDPTQLNKTLKIICNSPQIVLKSLIPTTQAAAIRFIDKNLAEQDLIGYYPIIDAVEIGCPVKDILVVGTGFDLDSIPVDRFVAGSIMGMSVNGAIGYDSVTGMFETRLGGSRGWKIATTHIAVLPNAARGGVQTCQAYFNADTDDLFIYNGVAWVSVRLR